MAKAARDSSRRHGEADASASVPGDVSAGAPSRVSVSATSPSSITSVEPNADAFLSCLLPSLTLWTVADSHLPLVRNAILNVLQALAPSSPEFSTAIADLKAALEENQRRRRESAPAGVPSSKEVIDEAISKEHLASCALNAMLYSAKNRDQANIWRSESIARCSGSTSRSR